jgi:predicted RNA-binding Zn-ribbon protein involved in translation (DUF1610 family)
MKCVSCGHGVTVPQSELTRMTLEHYRNRPGWSPALEFAGIFRCPKCQRTTLCLEQDVRLFSEGSRLGYVVPIAQGNLAAL